MSRELLDNFINRQISSEKALLTLFEPLAARIGSINYDDMVTEPAYWSANLAKAGRLLNMDGLVMGFDAEIYADACRSSHDISENKPFSIMLDAFGRLVQAERIYFGCLAGMAGPFTLAEKVLGDGTRANELKQKTIEMAEAFCKLRPDILMIREGAALGKNTIGMPERKAYNTLKNMAAYYNVTLGLYLEDYDPTIIADLGKLKLPFIFFGADQDGALPPLEAVKALAQDVDGIGIPLDFDNPKEALRQAEIYFDDLQGLNYIFTNLKELGRNTDLEATLSLVRDLRNIGGRA